MANIYFLSIVGVFVAGLLLLAWRLEKSHHAKAKARRKKLLHNAKLYYRHNPGQPRVLRGHGHTADLPSQKTDAWNTRIRRAGEELRDGTSFAATRLYSDDEKSKEEATTGLSMGVIEFTPEAVPKTSRTGR